MVIDNCEHLLAEVAAVVDRVLEASTTVSVLATSQAPLGVRGEHAWAVAPLSGPSGVSRDSVELFVDRARMARADFDADRRERSRGGRDLRAARSRAARDRAGRGARARDGAGRHRPAARSAAAAVGVERSARAGPAPHARRRGALVVRAARRRPSSACSTGSAVFAGPFTIEAAEAVVAGDGVDEWEVLDGILALVDKSLVVADEDRRRHALPALGDDAPVRAGEPRRRRNRRRCTATATPTTTPTSCLSRRPQLHGSGDRGRARRRSSASSRTSASRCAKPPTTTARHASKSCSPRCSRSGSAVAARRARRGPPSSDAGPISIRVPASWRSASPRR